MECFGTCDVFPSLNADSSQSGHVSPLTVCISQVQPLQTIPRTTWRKLSRSRSASCCLSVAFRFSERPSWLWSTAWPCWCTTHSACVALGPAAPWFTWILASLYWPWLYCLPYAFHRWGLLHPLLMWALAAFLTRWCSPGVQTRNVAAGSHTSRHIRFGPPAEDWERPRRAVRARSTYLGVKRIVPGGFCSRALPFWL